jgi:putative heme-binding domain-containing protein
MTTVVPGTHVRYTVDGTDPTDTTGRKDAGAVIIKRPVRIRAALFKGRVRVGPVLVREYVPGDAAQTALADLQMVDIKNMKSGSGSDCAAVPLQENGNVYTNRAYTWREVPDELLGVTAIQTSNDDADVGSTGDSFLSFSLADASTVYVAHDRRTQPKPEWLKAFARTQMTLRSGDATYELFAKSVPAGVVTLGGNTTDGEPGGKSQYVVLIKPEAITLEPPAAPLKNADVLPLVTTGSAARGGRLFFGAAICGNCHRIGGRGNIFAPHHSDIGQRTDAQSLLDAILRPSAVITEGYQGLNVTTKSGKSHFGFIRQESGVAVELVGADGKVTKVPVKDIAKRERLDTSVMPQIYDRMMSAGQMADLLAFLLVQKGQAQPAGAEPEAWGDPSQGFHLTHRKGGLDISLNGEQIMVYEYADTRTKRPYFAHVKTPGGVQVTRNHPPINGVDLTDHADYHPGLWLGFGKVAHSDFWRNRGRIKHERFLGDPTAGDEATFSTLNTFIAHDGKQVCEQETHFRLWQAEDGYVLGVDAVFRSGDDFNFGVQEEMGLGVRLTTPIIVRNGGMIINSHGDKNEKGTWGREASWWDYFGKVNDRSVGVMLMTGTKHRPVWSHSRDYGLLVANPFQVAKGKNLALTNPVAAGAEFRLSFGVYVHGRSAADESHLDRNGIYQEYLEKIGQ